MSPSGRCPDCGAKLDGGRLCLRCDLGWPTATDVQHLERFGHGREPSFNSHINCMVCHRARARAHYHAKSATLAEARA